MKHHTDPRHGTFNWTKCIVWAHLCPKEQGYNPTYAQKSVRIIRENAHTWKGKSPMSASYLPGRECWGGNRQRQVQPMKCLPRKHDELSSDSLVHVKSQVRRHACMIPAQWRRRQVGAWSLLSSRPRRSPELQA